MRALSMISPGSPTSPRSPPFPERSLQRDEHITCRAEREGRPEEAVRSAQQLRKRRRERERPSAALLFHSSDTDGRRKERETRIARRKKFGDF